MPDACIGGDVIVGFPGESKSDFKETYKFINNLNIYHVYYFPKQLLILKWHKLFETNRFQLAFAFS